jgi:hypothetical protein
MTLTLRKKHLLVLLALAGVITGVAWAVWSIFGTGPSVGRVGGLSTPTLTANPGGIDGLGDVFPGGQGKLYATAHNPNAGSLVLVSVALDSPNTITTNIGGCAGSNFTGSGNIGGLSIAIPPGDTPVVIPGGLSMASDAPSACQGALVTVPLKGTFNTTP